MKTPLILPFLLLPLLAMAQPLEPYRHNFFTTNPAPVVDVVAGSNTVVTPSLIGTSTRRFTVSATGGGGIGQTNISYTAVTNLDVWASTNLLSPFATNSSNATNFWGVLSPTNLPAGLSTSNYVGTFTGNGSGLTNLPTTAITGGATNQVLTQTGWSGYPQVTNLTLTTNGIGTAVVPSLWVANESPASLGAQQNSPLIMQKGQGWRSGNSTTMPVAMGWGVVPVQGSSANPTAQYTLFKSISNAVPTSTSTFYDDAGVLTLPAGGKTANGDTWGTAGNGFRCTGYFLTSGTIFGYWGNTVNNAIFTDGTSGPSHIQCNGGFIINTNLKVWDTIIATNSILSYSNITASATVTATNKITVPTFFDSPTNTPTDAYVLTATSTGGATAWKVASGGSQTPWTSDINGAGKSLTNVANVTATGTVSATNATFNTLTVSNNLTLTGTLTVSNISASSITGPVTHTYYATNGYTVCTASKEVYMVNAYTNPLFVLPDASTVAGQEFIFTTTNVACFFIVTNKTGTQTIANGQYLSYTNDNNGQKVTSFISDGAHWWLGRKGKTILPSASWSCNTNITFPNVTNMVTLDTQEANNGVGIALDNSAWYTAGVGSRIWVTNAGMYLLTFSAMWSKVGGGAANGDVWLRQDGAMLPRTMTLQTIQNATTTNVMTVNFILPVTKTTYFDLVGASPDGSAQMQAMPAITTPFARPAAPSMIVTIQKTSD